MTQKESPAFQSTVRKAGAGLLLAAGIIAMAWKLGAFEPVVGCLRAAAWPWQLIALHVAADGLIFVAYVWIPTVLVLIWRKLRARFAGILFVLFAAFIVGCGWTHLDNIITTWFPAYWYSGGVKLATGLVSIATAIVLTGLYRPILGLGDMAADLQAAKDEAERLKREAEARATRAEGEVTDLEKAQGALKVALAKAEEEKARAERLGRDALESARIAEAARSQAEAAVSEKIAIQRAVKDLSTPILPLTDDIAAMPLIGALDSIRIVQVMESATEYVSKNEIRVLILDLSGIPVVDTQVAASIIKTIQAVDLIGGTCIVTGIQPPVAQTMVELGIDMERVTKKGTLKAGLATAMRMVKQT